MQKVFANRAIQVLFLYFLYNFIALLWVEPENLSAAIKAVSKYWYYLVIPIMVAKLQKEYIPILIASFLGGVVLSVLLSYGIFFELIEMKHGTPDDPTPIMRHLDFGLFLAFSSLLLLNRLIHSGQLKYKIFYFLLFIFVAADIFILGGRVGYVVFIPVLFILLLYHFEHKFRALLGAVVVLGITLISAYNFSQPFKYRADMTIESMGKLYHEQNYCTSWGMRAGAFVVAKEVVSHNPLFGVGNKDHIDALQEIIRTQYPDMECFSWYMHYHNQYLEIITQIGLVGLLLFLAIFYFLLRLKFQSKEFETIKILFVSVYLVGFMAEPFLSAKQFTIAMFTLFFALLHAQYLIEQKSLKE